MTDEEFSEIVDEAIAGTPKEFLEKIENVSIVVSNLPNRYQLEKLRKRGEKGLLLGLYEGVPQTKRGRYGVGMTLPDKITIFKIPILSVARTREHLKEIVKNTVQHEIAHHFGMDESQVRDAEYQKRKRLKTPS